MGSLCIGMGRFCGSVRCSRVVVLTDMAGSLGRCIGQWHGGGFFLVGFCGCGRSGVLGGA